MYSSKRKCERTKIQVYEDEITTNELLVVGNQIANIDAIFLKKIVMRNHILRFYLRIN